MFPLAINHMNQGVLVVFHINYNHVIAASKVCWREDDSRAMCYDRTHTLKTVTTFVPTGIGEFSWYVSLLNQVGHSPARAIGSRTKYDPHWLLEIKKSFLDSFTLTDLRLACERFRSPSRVGVKIAVPIFMLALRLINHSELLANPIKCHFPAIFKGHKQTNGNLIIGNILINVKL